MIPLVKRYISCNTIVGPLWSPWEQGNNSQSELKEVFPSAITLKMPDFMPYPLWLSNKSRSTESSHWENLVGVLFNIYLNRTHMSSSLLLTDSKDNQLWKEFLRFHISKQSIFQGDSPSVPANLKHVWNNEFLPRSWKKRLLTFKIEEWPPLWHGKVISFLLKRYTPHTYKMIYWWSTYCGGCTILSISCVFGTTA